MFSALIFVALLALQSIGPASGCISVLTQSQVQQVKTNLAVVIKQGLNIPQAVRLAFHSCVGGCHGCMNFNNPANNGNFSQVFGTLTSFYSTHKLASVMSFADLLALAGIVAVEQGVIMNNNACQAQGGSNCVIMPTPNIPFQYCRSDNQNCANNASGQSFASGNFNFDQVMNYFATNFNMNSQQVTALLGAHTVGGATLAGSQFSGHWKEGTSPSGVLNSLQFNNGYYQNLVNRNIFWSHDLPGNWQWDGFLNGCQSPTNTNRVSFMLDSDVCLVMNVTVIAGNGLSSCSFPNQQLCQSPPATPISFSAGQCRSPSPTASLVSTYANNPTQWMNDFNVAFGMMINNGLTNPQTPTPDPSTTTTTTTTSTTKPSSSQTLFVVTGFTYSSNLGADPQIIDLSGKNRAFQTPPRPPVNLQDPQATFIDGGVMICGGWNSVLQATENRCWVYVAATKTWNQKYNLTQARDAATAVMISDTQWWVTGGYNSASVRLTSTELFTVGKGFTAWVELPVPNYWHSVVKVDAYRVMYFGGGQSSGLSGENAWMLNTITALWTKLPLSPLPMLTTPAGLAYLPDGSLEVVAVAAYPLENTTMIFSVGTSTWRLGKTVPPSNVMDGGSVQYGGTFLVVGGAGQSGVWAFNAATEGWNAMPGLKISCYFPSVTLVPDTYFPTS